MFIEFQELVVIVVISSRICLLLLAVLTVSSSKFVMELLEIVNASSRMYVQSLVVVITLSFRAIQHCSSSCWRLGQGAASRFYF